MCNHDRADFLESISIAAQKLRRWPHRGSLGKVKILKSQLATRSTPEKTRALAFEKFHQWQDAVAGSCLRDLAYTDFV